MNWFQRNPTERLARLHAERERLRASLEAARAGNGRHVDGDDPFERADSLAGSAALAAMEQALERVDVDCARLDAAVPRR